MYEQPLMNVQWPTTSLPSNLNLYGHKETALNRLCFQSYLKVCAGQNLQTPLLLDQKHLEASKAGSCWQPLSLACC